eukprot:4771764-Alexandrium_andersonii.AAC.1
MPLPQLELGAFAFQVNANQTPSATLTAREPVGQDPATNIAAASPAVLWHWCEKAPTAITPTPCPHDTHISLHVNPCPLPMSALASHHAIPPPPPSDS